MSGPTVKRQLSLAVVGAIHPNKRRPSRRFEIEMCVAGETVELRPEPNNPADERAIAVYSKRGIQLGYIPAERAPYIGACVRRGGVSAIFQSSDTWGATIRVALDGSAPVLPDARDTLEGPWPPPEPDDQQWYPDPEYPDD